jgi:hypothetical protein
VNWLTKLTTPYSKYGRFMEMSFVATKIIGLKGVSGHVSKNQYANSFGGGVIAAGH